MELKLINDQGQSTASVSASDAAFGRAYNESLVHQVVTAYLANARQGTRKQKTRGEINKSNKKPQRGRRPAGARAARKMFRAGLSAILSQLAREDRLAVVEHFKLDAPKTKALALKLKGMGLTDVLIVTDSIDENLRLSSRNLPHVNVVTAGAADPVSLLHYEKVLMTKGAVAKFEELCA